jgi:hypothetical protein
VDLCLTWSSGSGCAAGVRLGQPLLDAYLEFVAARCRPNTVLATAFDLKVFISAVAKSPVEVTSADVLGFVTTQRVGGDTATAVALVDGSGDGVSARILRRRLYLVRTVWGFLQGRGDVAVNPVPADCRPAACGPGGGRGFRCCALPGRYRRTCLPTRSTP